MICYICKSSIIGCLPALVAHYKVFHLLKPDSNYTCCEDSCKQSFGNLSSFKRHVSKKHIMELVPRNNPIVPGNQKNVLNSAILSSDVMISDSQGVNAFNSVTLINEFNFESSVKQLYESTVQFILSLYNNNNFNNSDVINIQTGIKDNILKPLASILNNVVKNEIQDHITLSKFNSLESVIKDPFLHCSTEYCLIRWLTSEKKLLSSVQQFTINNEMYAVNIGGTLNYSEYSTKGVLMPLKLQFKNFFEQGDNFKNMKNRAESLRSDNSTVSNFVQGKL